MAIINDRWRWYGKKLFWGHCETRCVISRVFVICRRPKCGRQKWLNNCQFHVIRQRCLKLWFEIENSFLWLDLYTIVKNRATSRIVYRIKLYSITLVKYVFHTHIFNTLKMTLIWPVATVCQFVVIVDEAFYCGTIEISTRTTALEVIFLQEIFNISLFFNVFHGIIHWS